MTKRLFDFNHWPKPQLQEYLCSSYESSLIADPGATALWLMNSGTDNPASGSTIQAVRAPNPLLATGNLRSTTAPGFLADPCSLEYAIDSDLDYSIGSKRGYLRTSGPTYTGSYPPTFSFSLAIQLIFYDPGSEQIFAINAHGGRFQCFFYNVNAYDLEIGVSWDNPSGPRLKIPGFFSDLPFVFTAVVKGTAGDNGIIEIYKDWQLFETLLVDDHTPNGADPANSQTITVTATRMSHFAFWDGAISAGGASGHRDAFERNFIGYSG